MRESKAVPAGSATLNYKDKILRPSRTLPARTGPMWWTSASSTTQADIFTYDPGFTSTASCESNITFIDGDKGILLYRGYPIDELAEHSNFLEICYLLLYGELPNTEADAEVRQGHHLSHDGA